MRTAPEPRNARTSKLVLRPRLGLAVVMMLVATATAWATSPGTAPSAGTSPCLVCRGTLAEDHEHLVVKGRTVRVCRGECLEHWRADPDRYFARLQARSALFDERSILPGRPSNRWLAVGLVVLVALTSAAVSSYIAIGRGHRAARWFLIGLLLPVVGPLTAAFKPPAPDAPAVRGLRKVPLTGAPQPCPSCSAPTHPTASTCPKCGTSLNPTETPETQRIRPSVPQSLSP